MSELRVNATATAGGTDAYRYVDTVYFTSGGTFSKASYPWLRAVRVKVQGAGGGGGTSTGDNTSASGGGGGAYGEKFITDIAGLSASETVTVGAGGASDAAGGTSSFGSYVSCTGGGGGTAANASGGAGGDSTGDDFSIDGQAGAWGSSNSDNGDGQGGGAFLGNPGMSVINGSGGRPAEGYGAGGSGGARSTGTDRGGGDGADGIVIVELYA